jgi:hypothetical protein
MPDMPSLDVVGLSGFMALILVALAVLWGINKAIIVAKN